MTQKENKLTVDNKIVNSSEENKKEYIELNGYDIGNLTGSYHMSLGEEPSHKVSEWEEEFKKEFGIHFSPSELQFAIKFIEDEISSTKKRVRFDTLVEVLEIIKPLQDY